VPLPPPQENLLDPPPRVPNTSALPPDLPLTDNGSGPRGGDLWRIRENLRSLREQAEESGMLPRNESPTATVEDIKDDLVSELAEVIETRDTPTPAPVSPFAEAPPRDMNPMASFAAQVSLPPPSPRPATVPLIQPTPAAVFAIEELPPPKEPTAPLTGSSIEYAGPAPSGQDYEPLFGSGVSASPPPAPESPETPAEALASLLQAAEAEPMPVVLQAADAAPTKPAFVVPAVGLSDRLAALAVWSCDRLGTAEVLLVDDYGDVLWGGHSQTPLVISAMMAWHATQRSTAESACSEPQRIDKALASGRALTVLPARTRYGVVSIAAIQDQPMAKDDESAIREALILAVEGPVEQPHT